MRNLFGNTSFMHFFYGNITTDSPKYISCSLRLCKTCLYYVLCFWPNCLKFITLHSHLLYWRILLCFFVMIFVFCAMKITTVIYYVQAKMLSACKLFISDIIQYLVLLLLLATSNSSVFLVVYYWLCLQLAFFLYWLAVWWR